MSIRSVIEGDPKSALKVLAEFIQQHPNTEHGLSQEAIDLLVEWLKKESE